MENTGIEKSQIIEQGERIYQEREQEIANFNQKQQYENGENAINLELIEIKYIEKIELTNEQGEIVELHAFMLVEQIGEEFQYIFRAKDKHSNTISLGMKRGENENADVVSGSSLIEKDSEEQEKIKADLKDKWKNRDKAKSVDELKNEQEKSGEEEKQEEQKTKEEKIAEDLSEKMKKTELEVSSYIKIMDNSFLQEYPETCENSKEIGLATLNDGTIMLISDYGDGFEIARGTEPAKPINEEVYDIDRQQQTVEKKSPNARINISGNGYKPNTKFLSLTYDQSGAPKIQSVDVAPDNTMIGRDIRTQGDDAIKEKSLDEQQLENEQGEDAIDNIADLITGEKNQDNDEMKQQIVESVLQSHKEELESLYGEEEEQEAAIRRYIQEATARRGIIVPEEIQQFAENNIEEDYQMTILRGRREH